MGIWDRLGNVIKSYLNDSTGSSGREKTFRRNQGDDDYDSAYEELENFLNDGKDEKKDKSREHNRDTEGDNVRRHPVPPELNADFAELGLSPNATENECKETYKKLLKTHHPDRHTGNPANLKKATEKSARINAAYDRLEKWFKLNKT